jgi:N-acetyl-anhydromuramyl-L-alanine amidase AmpD
MIIIDTPTKRVLPVRSTPPVAFVVHTTGETDLDNILAFYTDLDGYQPHYMIETIGTVRRIVADDLVAYHAKIDKAEAGLYRLGWANWSQWDWHDGAPRHLGQEFTGYRTWRDTWRPKGIGSPLDLVTGDHPNNRSIGIELQQPTDPGPLVFTEDQYKALAELLRDAGGRLGVRLDREHVLGHYDVSPMRRSTFRGGWDPGELFSYNHLFDLLPVKAVI